MVNDSRTSWAWRGRVGRDNAFAIGCVREEMKAGGRGRGSIILITRPAVGRCRSLMLIFASMAARRTSSLMVQYSDFRNLATDLRSSEKMKLDSRVNHCKVRFLTPIIHSKGIETS